MKNIRLIFILTFFIYGTICHAQTDCWNNVYTKTTKWDDPNTSNTEKWNWTTPGLVHPVYLRNNLSSPSIFVELPYFCTKNFSCNNGNTFQYEMLDAVGKPQDIYPENGWELVMKDFGTPNPPKETTGGRATPNPIFVLYNRYTGRMKTYLAVVGEKTANSAYLQISFSQNSILNSIYAHAEPVSKTLLEFEPSNKFKSLNEYALQNFEDDYQWMVSEIQTNYDPCMCTRNGGFKISSIEVTPFIITSSDINANIEGTFIQKLYDNVGGVSSESDGKTSFLDMTRGAAEAAIKGYNDFGSYKDQLNKILDNKNSAYKNKLVTEWFDDYVKKNPQYQGVSGLDAKNKLWDNLGRTDDAFKRGIGIENIGNYQNDENFTLLKSIAGYVPYVGTAIGLIDFFMNGGKEVSLPKPSPPMVFNVSLSLTGKISQTNELKPVFFQTPGFSNSLKTNLKPYYNNILGVFNVLRPPALKYAPIIRRDSIFKFYDFNNKEELSNISGAKFTNLNIAIEQNTAMNQVPIFKQYKLNEDIKYIVNPASNLNVEIIDACFILEYNNKPSLTLNYDVFPNFFNQNSLPYYEGIFNNSLNLSDKILAIENQFLDLEYVGSDDSIIRFRTKYVPLTCLKNETFTLFNGSIKPKVYVKMLIKYKRNDIIESELITQIVTYDLTSSFMNSTLDPDPLNTTCNAGFKLYQLVNIESPTFPTPILKHLAFRYEEFLSLSSLPYSYPSQSNVNYTLGLTNKSVNGNLYIPNNSIISSNTWLKAKSIVFGKNITINNSVELVSESDFILPEESSINPNAILRIEPFSNMNLWNCPDISIASLHATDDEISSICNDQKYKNSANLSKYKEDIIEFSKSQKAPIKFDLYPNPAKNNITLVLTGDDIIDKVNFSVMDVTGKIVSGNMEFIQVKNGTEINIDVSSLANGAYFINFNLGTENQSTKKLIIAK